MRISFAFLLLSICGMSQAMAACPLHTTKVGEEMVNGRPQDLCRCNNDEGYYPFRGRCQHKVAIEDELIQRIIKISETIKQVSEAQNFERNSIIYTQLSQKVLPVLGQLGAARLTRNPGFLISAVLSAAEGLGQGLLDSRSCNTNEDLRAACNNLTALNTNLEDTAHQLIEIRKK